MTIEVTSESRRSIRPFILVIAALVAVGLAGVTASVALAGQPDRRYLSPSRSVELVRAAFGFIAERSIQSPGSSSPPPRWRPGGSRTR
jgi:hypothetical protein